MQSGKLYRKDSTEGVFYPEEVVKAGRRSCLHHDFLDGFDAWDSGINLIKKIRHIIVKDKVHRKLFVL